MLLSTRQTSSAGLSLEFREFLCAELESLEMTKLDLWHLVICGRDLVAKQELRDGVKEILHGTTAEEEYVDVTLVTEAQLVSGRRVEQRTAYLTVEDLDEI